MKRHRAWMLTGPPANACNECMDSFPNTPFSSFCEKKTNKPGSAHRHSGPNPTARVFPLFLQHSFAVQKRNETKRKRCPSPLSAVRAFPSPPRPPIRLFAPFGAFPQPPRLDLGRSNRFSPRGGGAHVFAPLAVGFFPSEFRTVLERKKEK